MKMVYLEYFAEIAQCGSINKAAKNLGLSQPNLSTNIKRLEELLGFRVFIRRCSGIELTPEGRLLLQSTQAILREMGRIQHIPDTFAENQNLSIACTNSSLLMQAFIDFKRNNPGGVLQDSFKETGQIQAVLDVAAQEYRMAIIYCFASLAAKQRQRAEKYNLEVELLAQRVPVVATVSRSGSHCKRRFIHFEDLGRYPIVAYENFDYEDWLGRLGIHDSSRVMYVFDRGGMVDTLKNSSYIAVNMAGKPPQGVMDLHIEGFDDWLELLLLYPRTYRLNQRERQLVRHIKRVLRDLVDKQGATIK